MILSVLAVSQPSASEPAVVGPLRPSLKSNRWQEDWSPLADAALRTQAFDRLKYLPLAPTAYLSLGLQIRERLESIDQPGFGIDRDGDTYLLSRMLMHAGLRIGEHWQVFGQLEDARTFGKQAIGPADQNRLDLRLAFLAYVTPLGDGVLKLRAGRQEFAFDLQRFVSLRDGPNLRQAFDAAWVNYEIGRWRLIAFLSQPVQYADAKPFDDVSNRHFVFHTLRAERHVLGSNELSAYYARYEFDDSKYLDASGDERRDIVDVRFAGSLQSLDWDLEAMGQHGRVGVSTVRAWALGGRLGYTLEKAAWSPRFGIQFDAASGDRRAGDGVLQTFNPLFPNGSYFTLAGYTGYANLIHVKPALTVQPTDRLGITGAVGLLWRQTSGDAVYRQPDVAIPGSAGNGDRWTGSYLQLRGDWKLSAHLQAAIELDHYRVGAALRGIGGRDSSYVGGELKFSW